VFDSIKMLGFKCIHQPTCTNYPASSLLPKLATKLEVYQMDMEVTVKPSGAAIIIQLIYTGMFVMSKAAFDQGMNTYIFIFYRQAAGSVLLLPIALIQW
jgi:hypothetical protein